MATTGTNFPTNTKPAPDAGPNASNTSPALKRNRPYGVWKSGSWWCNCEPRKKAHILEVNKKSSPNKGRLYWKCAHYPYCDFFLWIEDAKTRQAALDSAPASESLQDHSTRSRRTLSTLAQKTPGFAQRSLAQFGFTNAANARHHAAEQVGEHVGQVTVGESPGIASLQTAGDSNEAEAEAGEKKEGQQRPREVSMDRGEETSTRRSLPRRWKGKRQEPEATPSNASKGKRKRDALSNGDSDEFGSLDSDDERQLTELTDRTVQESATKGVSGDTTSTPEDGSTIVVGGLATPSVSRALFPQSESSKRQKTNLDAAAAATAGDTMPSSRAIADAGDSASSPTGAMPNNASSMEDIAEEIMSVLTEQDLDGAAHDQVRTLLKKASMRTKMIAMGRDAARSALRERDIKIGRMQERVADLENKEKMQEGRITQMRCDMMKIWDNT